MKSHMLLWKTMAEELAIGCSTSTTLDYNKLERRVDSEGFSFMTITLPEFGKSFERSLDAGFIDRQDFQAFAWRSGLPLFLRGFLCQVFDTTSGRLLDEPSVDAIHAVRQLTLLFSKLFLISNEKRERAAMDGYIRCEQEISDFTISEAAWSQFRRVSNVVLGRVLLHLDRKVRNGDYLIPSHGPGATADGLKGNRKYWQLSWPVRLDRFFPSDEFLLPNPSFIDVLDGVDFLEPDAEIPVKVISVPKTQKTPRIIAMEPTAMQYAQQAVRRLIYESVERDYLLNTLIGFNDQTPNQDLARMGSLTGSLATLDLSEASDRVSSRHVEELLAYTPSLRDVVFACRSTKAEVPGHGVIPLTKFASMGSALSFPLEAMVFITMIFCGIEDRLNRPLTRNDVYAFLGRVRVFGDDIIIPVDCAEAVIHSLETFGSKVNQHKSFWTGKFRESCGKEFYAGHDVSIVKVRQEAPSSLRHVQEIISWVSLSNQCYYAGLWQSTKMIDDLLSGILKDFPVVGPQSPVLGRHSFMGYIPQKVGGRYQRPLVKGFVIRADLPRDPLDGPFALLKWFLQRGDLPVADENHLERAGRPRVRIKRGWASAY